MSNKYHAKRTWSELCQRKFDSKGECGRGEELYLLQKAGEIKKLGYQFCFELFTKPKITYTVDFVYIQENKIVHEDFKGVLTRETRVKLAWVKEKYGVDILITGR